MIGIPAKLGNEVMEHKITWSQQSLVSTLCMQQRRQLLHCREALSSGVSAEKETVGYYNTFMQALNIVTAYYKINMYFI